MNNERAKQIILELKEHCINHIDNKISCSKCIFVTTENVCMFDNRNIPNCWRMIDLKNIK